MPFAQGSRSALSFIEEVVFGVIPGGPSMIDLPFNDHSLDLKKSSFEGGDIAADRMVRHFRHGNKSVDGTINVDFRAGDFDPFIESAFYSALAGGIIKVGVDEKSFTIEDRSEDITQFQVYTGCICSRMAISARPNAMVTAAFDFMGKDKQILQTPQDVSTTPASANAPFDSFTATISEGGGSSAIVTAIDFALDNGLDPAIVVGSDTTPQISSGRGRVSGTLSVYYQDEVLIEKFINETISTIEIAFTDGVATYTFLMPEVKYNNAAAPVSDESSRIVTLPFVSTFDIAEATVMKLTIT